MRNLPTDLQILDAIYNMYFDEYANYGKLKPGRRDKIYVPLDIRKIATKLGTEGDIVFGRLYYVLERRYAYKDEGGVVVHFFGAFSLPEKHSIHFPYMASVLAQLRQEHRTARNNIIAAGVSAVAATVSVAIAIWPSPAPPQASPIVPAASAPLQSTRVPRNENTHAPLTSHP